MEKTHYDILKVSRDAPIEVIRAAYRVLSLKHHPDRHPEDPTAATAMRLLNQAYTVLSDPERRRAYDVSMREVAPRAPNMGTSGATVERSVRTDSEREIHSDGAPMVRRDSRWRQYGILLGVAVLVLVGVAAVLLPARQPQLDAWVVVTPPAEDSEAYIRRLAREVMQPSVGRPAADPTALEGAALPSDDLPTSATAREMPVQPANVPSDHDTPVSADIARPAPDSGQESRSTSERPSSFGAVETEPPLEGQSASPEGSEASSGMNFGIVEDGQDLR